MRATWLLIALLVLPMALAVTPARADDGEMRAEIQEVLQQRHPNDTDAWWRALGPEAPGVIIAMYQESSNMLHKIHLLQGLSAFQDSQQAVDFLKGESKSPTSVIRGAAVGALGASQGEKALETLAEALQHEDAQTRFAAAKAIRRIGTSGANEVLKAYLKSEKVDWISRQVLADEKPQGLKPVDRASPGATAGDADLIAYAGGWKGFWIAPELRGKKIALAPPTPVSAELRIFGKNQQLAGSLTAGSRIYELKPTQLQLGGRWKGSIRQTSPVRSQPAWEAAEMELSRYQKTWTLVLRIPSSGASVVMLKNQ